MIGVTVLMPVWNSENYVGEAIESVLRQSYTDFELLIVDDGSEDGTVDVIHRYHDARIRLVRREHHFIGSLNEGLRLARGKYIARMDSDDVMHSERLMTQVRRMEEMPEIAVCGSWMRCFGKGVIFSVLRTCRGKVADPLLALLERNILYHPTVMIRKSFLTENNLEYKDYARAEDYKLWVEIAESGGQFYVEPQVLLFYRVSQQQVSAQQGERLGKMIRREILESLLKSSEKVTGENRGTALRLLRDLYQLESNGVMAEARIIVFFKELLKLS